jgi:diaminobutyrate-2-oxoglutarate transaminase
LTIVSRGPEVALSEALAGDTAVFEAVESEVRLYCRTFPAVFDRASGAEVHAEDGRVFVDFFCGAGALNYGHNDERIKVRLLEYLADDGVAHALDMATSAKRAFLERLCELVLEPRGLAYKVQFCGPTGADAVEAALKLARKATGRRGVVAFTGSYHGMSSGALAVTGSRRARRAGSVLAQDVTFVPFEDGPSGRFDSIGYLERILSDPSGGMEVPAAVIVEPVQMEGGVYPASAVWMRALRTLTRRHEILLICDEIQTGCGRTGTFFCFEQAEVRPDLVTLSKSIGGYGLPLSLVLLRPELDVWEPGEHTGTFRGNQLAFVAGAAAVELWDDPQFVERLARSSERAQELGRELVRLDGGLSARGRGMVLGIDTAAAGGRVRAQEIQRRCFEDGLLVELCGREDAVVKLMPPLTIEPGLLEHGFAVLRRAIRATREGSPGR